MNIQTAEKQINKLLEYVREIHSDNKTIYTKSKVRLNNIAITCNQIVALISEVLESEILNNVNETEFGYEGVGDKVLFSVLAMEESLDQLKAFMSDNLDKRISGDSVVYSEIIFKYTQVFSVLSENFSNLEDGVLKELVYILSIWLNARFKYYSNGFKFDIRMLPIWIRDIVVVYSYHIFNRSADRFIDKFINWCGGLTETCKYGVPYEVHKLSIDKSLYKQYLTMQALVLWDSLLDFGMLDLSTDFISDGFVSGDDMRQLFIMYNKPLIKKYDEGKVVKVD